MNEISQKSAHSARLKRAVGQMQGVLAMMEVEAPTQKIAMQLRAAERALAEARKVIVQEQIDQHLDEGIAGTAHVVRAVSRTVKELSKYL